MLSSLFIASLSSWIVYIFPSMADYVKYIGPAIFGLASLIGVFTNMLPEPGHVYPVPDVSALEIELGGHAKFILRLATFARSLTITVNWFVATAVYSWFYSFTNYLTNKLPSFLKPKSSK